MSQVSSKHHYIPVFYLKAWGRPPQGKLCEFSKQYGNVVKTRWPNPDGTGYEKNLNTMSAVRPEMRDWVESSLLAGIDSPASEACARMRSGRMDLTEREAVGWSRFVFSLLIRNPEDLDELRSRAGKRWMEVSPESEAEYQAARDSADLPTMLEFLQMVEDKGSQILAMRLLNTITHNSKVLAGFRQMIWRILPVQGSQHEILTSDRPLVMTNGIKSARGHLVLPIGPRLAFAMFDNVKIEKEILNFPQNELVKQMNTMIVSRAVKYVYGTDDRQLRFVQNRMSTVADPSLFRRHLPTRA